MGGEGGDLAAYRARARKWLEANVAPRDPGQPRVALGRLPDPEGYLAEQRARQKDLWEAGFAGITWPRELGGQGLPKPHEQAFQDEAAGFALPDFGVLGITTFSSCVPTLLVHATPEFLAEHIPAVLAGGYVLSKETGRRVDKQRRDARAERGDAQDAEIRQGEAGRLVLERLLIRLGQPLATELTRPGDAGKARLPQFLLPCSLLSKVTLGIGQPAQRHARRRRVARCHVGLEPLPGAGSVGGQVAGLAAHVRPPWRRGWPR